ncbi:hypothetical protein KAU11_08200 [Candidatus Babeliales bacterium]|nr:hypothetical protein [Candidatus Babeliales bacterium]
MIIDKKVLGELLLAAGYGELVSVSEAELISVHSPAPVSRLKEGDLADFNIAVELEPVVETKDARDTFSPTEVLEALREVDGIIGNIVTIDMLQPNTHKGTTLKIASPEQSPKVKAKKPRQLKRLGQLKGLTIESVKTVLKGQKTYIKTTDGAGICLEGAVPKQNLHPDENIALGLLTKEDLASIAKAKKMGLIP